VSTEWESAYVSNPVARVRAWWDASTYLGDVALLFTIVTVGNSAMMLTGLDEPKVGTFAYVHLLGRLGIIALLVGLFYLREVHERLARWRQPKRHAGHPDRPRRSPHTVLEAAIEFFFGGWINGTARVFTVLVATACALVLAAAGLRPPAGGVGLYRNLVLLVGMLLLVMLTATRWWQRRRRARASRPD
jgi:uncharacterized membrane protein